VRGPEKRLKSQKHGSGGGEEDEKMSSRQKPLRAHCKNTGEILMTCKYSEI